MKICPKCNSQMNDIENICNMCGFQFFQQLIPQQQPKQQPYLTPTIQLLKPLPNNKGRKLLKNPRKIITVLLILNLVFLSIVSIMIYIIKEYSNEKSQLQQDYDDSQIKYEVNKKKYFELDKKYNTTQDKYSKLFSNYSDLQLEYVTLGYEYSVLKNKYANENEVLNRERILFRNYSVIMDWNGHSSWYYPKWTYIVEWNLSSYISSLKQDHSLNMYYKESILKFVEHRNKNMFYLQTLQDNFPNNYDLANAILDISHAIEYKKDVEGKEDVRYPNETLIEGCGDCEDVSLLCFALLEENGLDAVIILWDGHVEVGVYLEEPPDTDSGNAWYVTNNNKKYYICECTGDYNVDVGDMPPEYQNKTPIKIYDL